MPTYSYQCRECGHQLEEFQPITAEPLVRCPSCDKDGLERIIGGGGGLIFKGSGFYLTDYRKESGKEKPAAAKTDKKGETKDTSPKPSGGEKPAKE